MKHFIYKRNESFETTLREKKRIEREGKIRSDTLYTGASASLTGASRERNKERERRVTEREREE